MSAAGAHRGPPGRAASAGPATVGCMLVGAQVRGGGPLAAAVARGVELGAEAIQVFTQSPRMWRPSRHAPEAVDAFRRAMSDQPHVRQAFCHATYLVNLGTPDADLLERSRACLADNLRVARAMGADGLVLHVGSHLGAGMDGCLDQVADALAAALEAVDGVGDAEACPVLLENTAGAGGTIGRDIDELAAIFDRVAARSGGAEGRLGMCLDTQHLWASGVDFTSEAAADAVVATVEATIGLDRLRCIHLNDSAVPLGANRDRHANLGDGTIGTEGLAMLLGHPALQHLAAVLEVPGDGHGPTAAQVALARATVEDGVARRRAAAPRPPGGAPPSGVGDERPPTAPRSGLARQAAAGVDRTGTIPKRRGARQ